MRGVLSARIPPAVMWTMAGLFIAGCLVFHEFAYRPHNGIRVGRIRSEARSALPLGSSREQVASWLETRGLPWRPVYDKGGQELQRYLVRMENSSWMEPGATFWMTFEFDREEKLEQIDAEED